MPNCLVLKIPLIRRFSILIFLTVVGIVVFGNQPPYVQPVQAQMTFDEAIQAVVHVKGCADIRCDNPSKGSGAIIHPDGIILTAWHVTVKDPYNISTPEYLNDFIIEVTTDIQTVAKPRYRARRIAAQPEKDLALLRIYWDEVNQQPVEGVLNEPFPALPLSKTTPKPRDSLTVMGYPAVARGAIRYPTVNQSGGTPEEITLQRTLGLGYSGGPALIEGDEGFEIVGIVIRRRGDLGEEAVLRKVSQLNRLAWGTNEYQVWGNAAQVVTYETNGEQKLEVGLQVRSLDYVDRPGRLIAYGFELDSRHPWLVTDNQTISSPNNQLVLSSSFSAADFVSNQTVFVSVSASDLDIPLGNVMFRVVLWDETLTRILWQADQWFSPQVVSTSPFLQPIAESSQAPTNTAPTPDEESEVVVPQVTSVDSNVNLRRGPSTDFEIIGALIRGNSLSIVGRNTDASWWQVETSTGLAWIAASVTEATNVEQVPVVSTPPPPAPVVTQPVIPEPLESVVTPLFGHLAVPVQTTFGRFDTYIYRVTDGAIVAKIENAHQPNFRPDGAKLLVNGEGNRGDIQEVDSTDWRISQSVSSSPTDSHPFYKPDGSQMVIGNDQLAKGSDNTNKPYIFVQCNIKDPRQEHDDGCKDIARRGKLIPKGLGDIQGRYPIWLDGDQIAYQGCNTWARVHSVCGIYRVGAWYIERNGFGGDIPALVPGTASTDAIPSDGHGGRFLFHNRQDDDWEVYSATISGVSANLSNHPQAVDLLGTFSPDGNWVAFVSDRSGAWAVWVVPGEGGEARLLFPLAWERVPDNIHTERMSWGN